MASVDNRVVSMTFDNKSFQSRIADTLKSLQDLKTKLSFGGKSGFDELSKSAGKVNLNPLSAAVEGVSGKFLALSTIGITALASITTKAIDAGLKVAKALTITPVLDGFKEYEQNINSIQTILANTNSKGSTLGDVTGALAELNEFADKTIYNFGEMTRNIGTFTAAGVDLETSVGAIKGIANIAAVSGSSSQQAATAMYQLSQAIASGSVKLMDWNSVVNAGLGGEVFQNALFESGKAMGTLNDVPIDQTFQEWTDAGNTFRGSLESGWITGEVLTNTLQGFTGDLTDAQLKAMGYTDEQIKQIQEFAVIANDAATKVKTFTQLLGTVQEAVGSGWAESFRIILGDFDEAKELFTGISDAITGFLGKQADMRNQILSTWKLLGGRDILLNALKTAFMALADVVANVEYVFRRVFPKKFGFDLLQITEGFARLTDGFKRFVDNNKQSIARIFLGIFSVIKIGIAVVKGIASVFATFFKALAGGGGESTILKIGEAIGVFLFNLQRLLVEGGLIEAFFGKINTALTKFLGSLDFSGVIDGFTNFIGNVIQFVKDIDFQAAIDKVLAFKDRVVEFVGAVNFDPLIKGVNDFKDTVKEAFDKINFDGIQEKFAIFKASILGLFGGGEGGGSDGPEESAGRFNALIESVGSILSGVTPAFTAVGDVLGWLGSAFTGFWKLASPIIDVFRGAIDKVISMVTGVEGPGDADIAKALGITSVAGALILARRVVRSITDLFDSGTSIFEKISEGIGDSIDILTGSLQAMQTNIKADTLQKIAIALGLLVASIFVLSLIDPEKIAVSMGFLVVAFGQLATAMAILTAISSGPKTAIGLAILSIGLIALAGAVLLLAIAMRILSGLGWEEMAVGLAAISALIIGLVLAAKPLSAASPGMIKAGIAIGIIALALLVLAAAIFLMSRMELETIGVGLVGIGGSLLLFSQAAGPLSAGSPGIIKAAIAIGIMAVSLFALSFAIKKFGEMNPATLAQGMGAIGIALLIMAATFDYLGRNQDTIAAASVALLAMAGAMVLMAMAIEDLGSMDLPTLAKGIAAIAATLVILAIAMRVMQGSIGGGIGVLLAAFALGKLKDVVQGMSDITWTEIAKALVLLAGAMVILGVAGYLLAPLAPALALLGLSMLLFGAGVALMGVGAKLFAEAVQTIVNAGASGLPILVALLDIFIAKLPEIAVALATALGQFILTLVEQVPPIVTAFGDIITAILDLIVESIPKLVEVGDQLITALIDFMNEKVPDFIEAGITIIVAFLESIRDHIEEIVELGSEILISFMEGLIDQQDELVSTAIDLLVSFLEAVAGKLGDVVDAGVEILVELINGITENVDDLGAAGTELIVAWIKAIGDMLDDIINAGKDVLVQLITGIGDNISDIVDAGVDAVVKFLEGVGDNVKDLADAGFQLVIDVMNGISASIETNAPFIRSAARRLGVAIIDGMTGGLFSKARDLYQGIRDIAAEAIGVMGRAIGFNSPAKKFIPIGKGIPEGLALGVSKDRLLNAAINRTGKDAILAAKKVMSKVPDFALGLENLNPTITPVLDLTQVQKDAKGLNNLFNSSSTSVGLSQARFISANTATTSSQQSAESTDPVVREIRFEQNNYSPKSLSEADIYRATRGQIARAKEELSIS